jgi:hypothetical protein
VLLRQRSVSSRQRRSSATPHACATHPLTDKPNAIFTQVGDQAIEGLTRPAKLAADGIDVGAGRLVLWMARRQRAQPDREGAGMSVMRGARLTG